jgi:two-component system sensor histidine kinase RegB
VVRALGGHIEARNRELGGALVTLQLPLASLTLEPPIEESTADEL